MLATIAGVAASVALIASIGSFLAATTSRMTARAAATVPLDWQVELQPGASDSDALRRIRAYPGVRVALPVTFAATTGLQATTGGSTQMTGPGQVVGVPPGYGEAFPGEIRVLSGDTSGAVLAQQTAANLHARPGDTVSIGRQGARAARVTVTGVVDLPAADSLFQKVGAPPGAQAQAPPDNVVLLPQSVFNGAYATLAAGGATSVRTQVHVELLHRFPSSPSAAFTKVTGASRNLETRLAGAGLVGDNLGTALDQARSDALYAQLLFLFLGVPGAILVALITIAVATSATDRRRREAGLLRTRGASTGWLVQLALAETALTAGAGAAIGLLAARVIGAAAFGTVSFGASATATALWATGAVAFGFTIAALAIALPAWRDARAITVSGQRRAFGRTDGKPVWQRYYFDFAALAIAALVFWQASRSGYSLVLAPEGVPQISVNWYALLAPVMGWIGVGLLTYRFACWVLAHGRGTISRAARPLSGELSYTVAATMFRRRRVLARGVALVALTIAFAGSTSVFNSTYRQQAEVDARLSNGADVTVTESPGANVGPERAGAFARVRGVRSVEPLQHRYAYVGADLQDLYGVRPTTIASAGRLQNSWFAGGSANQLMQRLRSSPDGVLVSDETVKDFQLRPGDLLRLRLQVGHTPQLKTVPFHYVGVVKEFPTAPRDSFLVANAAYVGRATGTPAVGTFLIQTDGTSPATVAHRVRAVVGSSAQVADIVNQRHVVGSSLTAVELSGLTRVELAFSLLLVIAATGLVLGLGVQERRRSFAIAGALGAKPRQLGGFVWSDSIVVTAGGVLTGAVIAALLSHMLVKVLTGVFDPPPDSLAIPWAYLSGVVILGTVATWAADWLALRSLRRPSTDQLRDL